MSNMSNATSVPDDDTDAPLPFPTKEERDALVLEFQRLAARLARARLISVASSTRMMKTINRERRAAEERRTALGQLVVDILLSFEDGTLRERVHYVRQDNVHVALHLESTALALFRAGRGQLTARELRSLFGFGWRHFRDVVVSRSSRARFDSDGDRRRVVVLHEPSAYEFVGTRKKSVPFC